MIRYHRLEHRFVEGIPERLGPGFLYISLPYATAMHLCCCGCGREVVTPLSPAQWNMTFDGESVSLHPSIGSWQLPCRSHYLIRHGRVLEAGSWSEEEVADGQARDRRTRNGFHVSKTTAPPVGEEPPAAPTPPPVRQGWLRRIADLLTGKR
jgi:hypothetical protein